MPNALTSTGLTTATQSELINNFTAAMQAIYGADINLDQDTPDGQWMMIIIQAIIDLEDLMTQIYNSFDPDLAIGTVLDQRVAINGIQRVQGTFTVTNITITVASGQSVNLLGLDQSAQPAYTVADNAGNEWELVSTQTGLGPGAHVLVFQSAVPGAVLTVPNTITVPISIVLGVQSINNPTTFTSLGTNEETDAQLRIRRQKSVALPSKGFVTGLLAALENINGVTSAFVYENVTNATDGNGVPGHSIWVIVAGAAAAADIANAIYVKRNAGCGMFGSQSFNITQPDGSMFPVLWDDVAQEALFIQFNATSLDGVTPPNIALIRQNLPGLFIPSVAQQVNVNSLASIIQEIDQNTLVTGAGFSNGQTQTLNLSGIPASGTFVLNYNGAASAAINWNDSIGTIQSKLQAMTGLSAATVTGSLASQQLVFNLSAIASVADLLHVTSNSLQTSAPAAINFSYNEGFTNTLSPTSKKFQFQVTSQDIIILAMILNPPTSTVTHGTTEQFSALGGFGTVVYSLSVNNSGGSINSSTGLYTAGSTPSVADTVLATDELGNTATATVSVI